MINYKNLEKLRENFVKVRSSLTEIELEKALGFESKKDKILSLFSIRFKTLKRLINEGVLVYVYIYKNEYHINGNSNFFKNWIIFSPSLKYEENPDLYSKISAELDYFLKNSQKEYKNLIKKLDNKENDFALFELPEDLFNERLFISTSYCKEKTNPNLKPGVNVCLMNRKISKKLFILPEIFLEEHHKN